VRAIVGIATILSVVAFGGARAADMAVKSPPPPPVAAYTWTGWYAGLQAGGVFGNSQHCDPAGSGFCTGQFNVDGFVGGGTLGYNWQNNNWIFGLETDFSGSSARGTTQSTAGFGCLTPNCYTDLYWFGTVRGRVGPTLGSWFPYVTGGLAYGELHSGVAASTAFADSATNTETGWTLGGGVEYALAPKNWSVKLEYLFFHLNDMFYDTRHVCGAMDCTAEHNNFNLVRIGLNYRFN
jgi:outer membrane immunogenic protein